jgi:transposase
MNFVGIDLHKKIIVLCALNQDRKVLHRRTFACCQVEEIKAFFAGLGPFRAVVEATASYEWFVALIEPLADKVVLANPKKLRVIAESVKKTDKLDAQVLAEFLARDMMPEAYRPSTRQREHRALVRHRQYLKQCSTSLKNKMRRIATDYNADRKDLSSAEGWKALAGVKLRPSDRFVLDQLHAQWESLEGQLLELKQRLKTFAAEAPARGGSPGQAGHDPRGGAGDDRCGAQRVGGCKPVPLHQGGVRLCRAGAGGAPERGQGEGAGDHQGRRAAVALGLGGSGLARDPPECGVAAHV